MIYSAFLHLLRRFLVCIFFFNVIPIYAVFEGFQPVVIYDGGDTAVAVGDFNNNGILDLAATNFELGNVTILLGNGDGTFQNQMIFEVGTQPLGIAVGDFNNDGILDLAVINTHDRTVSILLGNGDGTFQNQMIFEVGANPSGIAVGDFNNNGILDLAVINANDGNVSILLGNGDGTFQNQMIFEVGTNPSGIAVGDFNNDGNLDLAVTNYDLGTVSILLGNGDGTFQNQIIFEVGTNPIAIAVGDFNNDGNLDLAVALYLNLADDPEGVSILLGNGDGTFQPAVFYPAVGFAQAIVTGDFNNDGILDLAVIDFNDIDYDFSILLGNGDGTFQQGLLIKIS
jgi:FG-GAP-like repeat